MVDQYEKWIINTKICEVIGHLVIEVFGLYKEEIWREHFYEKKKMEQCSN